MEKIKILLFAANPAGTDPLDLNREFREIDEEIRYGEYRDGLELIYVPATRPVDLMRKLNKERPHIVHFSGHGSKEAIYFEDEDENDQDSPGNGFGPARDMKLVNTAEAETSGPEDRTKASEPAGTGGSAEILQRRKPSRWWSSTPATVVPSRCAIGDAIGCVVSMDKEISDSSAIRFAASFYGALAFGRSVRCAFDQAVARLKLERTFEELTPTLLVREGIDAEKLVLLGSSSPHPDPESPFTIPFPRNAGFVGRDQDLERLHQCLCRQQPVGIRPAGLMGMGGIGKTQLAVEYAYRHRRRTLGAPSGSMG